MMPTLTLLTSKVLFPNTWGHKPLNIQWIPLKNTTKSCPKSTRISTTTTNNFNNFNNKSNLFSNHKNELGVWGKGSNHTKNSHTLIGITPDEIPRRKLVDLLFLLFFSSSLSRTLTLSLSKWDKMI